MGRWDARQAVARGAFHLFILAFSIPADPCYLGTSQMYQTDGMYNYTGLPSQVVDDAFQRIRRASEGDDLRAAVAQIDSAIREAGAALHLGKLDSGKCAAERTPRRVSLLQLAYHHGRCVLRRVRMRFSMALRLSVSQGGDEPSYPF